MGIAPPRRPVRLSQGEGSKKIMTRGKRAPTWSLANFPVAREVVVISQQPPSSQGGGRRGYLPNLAKPDLLHQDLGPGRGSRANIALSKMDIERKT